MTGWLIANSGDYSLKERRLITLMAIAPDIDGIFILGPSSWREWHRTFGHNIFLGVALPLVALFLIPKNRRAFMLPLLFGAMASHFILDLFVTGWWLLMPFWPLSKWGILMSRWIPERIMKYHIQLGLFAVLLIPTIYLIIKHKRTPVEILGKAIDGFVYRFVTLPFTKRCAFCTSRAFYMCEECGAPLCGRHRRFKGLFKTICRENHPKNKKI